MIDEMIEELKEKMVLEFEQEVAEILDLFSDVTIADFNIKTIEKRLCRKVFDEIAEKYKTQEQKWISVEESIPEEKINPVTNDFFQYPVIFKSDDVMDVRYYKFGRGHWWNGCGIMDSYVIAWMPLPKYGKEIEIDD